MEFTKISLSQIQNIIHIQEEEHRIEQQVQQMAKELVELELELEVEVED